MNNFGTMSGLFLISEWIMKFAVINLLWIGFNLPIVFIFLNMLLIEVIEDLYIFVIPLTILMPIFLFPATTAMFATVRGWIVKSKDSDKLFKSYWRYYKENYLRSLIGGTIITGIWVILAVDIYYLSNINKMIMYILIVLGIILYVFTINFFSVTAHYNMKLFESFKSVFLITVGSPLVFMVVVMGSSVLLYISINYFQWLLVFATSSLISFLSFALFYRSYLKRIDQQD